MKKQNRLLDRCQSLLEKRELHSGRRRLNIAAPGTVDFSSNDFLSLSTSEPLRTAYLAELARASDVPLGSGGSRLLDGNSAYVEDIERAIATFHNAPSGLLFNSGFDANSGIFSCVPQPGDAILYDEYIHASAHEGMRLSRATVFKKFVHNCVTDFEECLRTIITSDRLVATGARNVLVAVESVYSMDGDVAPIRKILEIIKRLLPEGNGHLIIDEAHSTGVYGLRGRGVVCELGVEDQVLARLHTFGKALSSGGAIVLCSPVLREYLINYARSLIYTTALGLPTLAMIKTVYYFIQNGRTEVAQHNLWDLIAHFHLRLCAIPKTNLIQVSSDPPQSPIFSICTSSPRELAMHCQHNGFMVRPIVPPTVPNGGERIRVCLHSGNSVEEVDHLVKVIIEWVIAQESSNGSNLHTSIRARI